MTWKSPVECLKKNMLLSLTFWFSRNFLFDGLVGGDNDASDRFSAPLFIDWPSDRLRPKSLSQLLNGCRGSQGLAFAFAASKQPKFSFPGMRAAYWPPCLAWEFRANGATLKPHAPSRYRKRGAKFGRSASTGSARTGVTGYWTYRCLRRTGEQCAYGFCQSRTSHGLGCRAFWRLMSELLKVCPRRFVVERGNSRYKIFTFSAAAASWTCS